MQISNRALQMPASPIRKLVPMAQTAKKRGIKVYHLNIGQPDLPTPQPFFDHIQAEHPKVLAYADSEGTEACLNGMRGYYENLGFPLSHSEIMITTGGSEALLFAMATCCNPGDEILSFEPLYTNYNGISTLLDVTFKALSTDPEQAYHLPSREVVENAITEETKGILLCNPNNPTGTVYTEAEVRMIGELCQEHGLWLFSDEVYREFAYEGTMPFSTLNLHEIADRVVVLDSLSKRYSLCGGRIGCLVSRNHEVISAALKMGQARLSSPTLEQIGAEALFQLPQQYFADVATEYKKRRDVVLDWIEKIPGAYCKKPEGAFYLFVTLPVTDSEHFAEWLLTDFEDKNETLMLAPGPGFYASSGFGNNEARLAYVLKEEDLNRSMDLLQKALTKYLETQ